MGERRALGPACRRAGSSSPAEATGVAQRAMLAAVTVLACCCMLLPRQAAGRALGGLDNEVTDRLWFQVRGGGGRGGG